MFFTIQTLHAQREEPAEDSTENGSALFKTNNELLKTTDINLLLRSSLEIPVNNNNPSSIKLNEARFEVRGAVTDRLNYRVRYRLNRTSQERSLDNSPGSLDIASVDYNFGTENKWNLMIGKQAAFVGSWEFEANPTYEYQYSEFVNNQLNLFAMGMKLGYTINENHSLHLQLQNTFNNSFNVTHTNAGYETAGREAAKFPLGAILAWRGEFFEKKLQTFYTANVSQFAKNETNTSFAIGNKLNLSRLKGYLDLHSSGFGVDYTNIASPSVNNYYSNQSPVFARDINYKAAILRLDYEFIPQFFITAKGFYETASSEDDAIGSNFRHNIGLLGGLEYQPVKSQNMKMFAYYYNNQKQYKENLRPFNPNQTNSMIGIGFLYFVNAL